jgi:hypothetical protein
MMGVDRGTLLTLTGGVQLKQRVQHPKVHERKDRGSYYWFFRYRHDELLPSRSINTTRKFHTIGPSRGENAIAKKQAEAKRDAFLAELNPAPTRCEAAVVASQPVEVTAILFGKLAELWRKDYVDNPKMKLATPTREKYRTRLDNHILPQWKDTRLREFRTKQILDWLQHECSSWHMMIDLRNIMSGIFARGQFRVGITVSFRLVAGCSLTTTKAVTHVVSRAKPLSSGMRRDFALICSCAASGPLCC